MLEVKLSNFDLASKKNDMMTAIILGEVLLREGNVVELAESPE
jgi:hypothetical protein